ncbi:MAG: glycosyltransferase [Candidatus Hodarchaeales archaeon]
MKVLQVSKLYCPWIGGVEKVVQDIAEGLKDKIDVEVLVCQPHGLGKRKLINDIRVTKTSSVGMFYSMPLSPTFPFQFARKSRKVDLLHFHLPFPIGVLSQFMFGDKNKKIVVTYHSDIVRQAWALDLYWPILNRFLDRADKILVTSANLLNSSERLKPFLHKCEVVPLSIDVLKFTNGTVVAPKSKEVLVSMDEKIILFVGRLIYYKGVQFLIAAMLNIKAKLIIIGEGKHKKKLERMVKNLKLDSKVFFLGKQSDAKLRYWYKNCDVFVLPSVERSEAFGIVQLEAMAFKKPVINTDLPTGVPFVSKHGQTGLTVPPEDPDALSKAINRLLDNDDLRLRFGENAYARVKEKFSSGKMIDPIYSIYSELIN